jgi:hypothetical protein
MAGLRGMSLHLHSAFQWNEPVLERWLRNQCHTRLQFQVDSDVLGIATGVRPSVAYLANEDSRNGSPAQIEAGQIDMMFESGRTVPGRLRLCHPQLGQVNRAAGEMLLGVHHSMTGSHQIQFLRPDRLLAPQAVAVKEFAS